MENLKCRNVVDHYRMNACKKITLFCPEQMDLIRTLFQDADIDGVPAG